MHTGSTCHRGGDECCGDQTGTPSITGNGEAGKASPGALEGGVLNVVVPHLDSEFLEVLRKAVLASGASSW